MAIIYKMYQAAGMTPEKEPGMECEESERENYSAAVEDHYSSPGCHFYSCFACEKGHCTVLEDNNFGDKFCPFFKSRAQVKQGRQDALDRLLINGRADLVNKYEEILTELGVIAPEIQETEKSGPDDDLTAARAEFARFQDDLEKEKQQEEEEMEADDVFVWDADDEDDGDDRDAADDDSSASGEADEIQWPGRGW